MTLPTPLQEVCMPASSRVFPLLLALALAAPMAGALASPLYAVTVLDGAGSDASGVDSSGAVDLDSLIDPAGSWEGEGANAIIDSGQIGATACRTSGECDAVRLDPQ